MHAKTWEWAHFFEADRERHVNLAAYMNASTYVVSKTCLLEKAFLLFHVDKLDLVLFQFRFYFLVQINL
jgi:hypothetical protein